MENQTTLFGKIQKSALLFGLIGLAASAYGFMTNHDQFAQSYLLSYMYWLALAGGSLGILMLHHMVNGRWGFVIQRPLEAGARTFPLMILLFVPIAFSIHELYEWSHLDVVAHDHILQMKQAYLNETSFLIRAAVYLIVFAVLGAVISKWSNKHDTDEDAKLVDKIRVLAAPGILIFVLITSVMAIDWMMSLEPHWFSSIYGVVFMVGQGLATFAFMSIIAAYMSKREPFKGVTTAQQFHDLGNLMFAFTILWTYMSFSQYIIIWSGNLPEETVWYMQRSNMGGQNWLNVTYVIVAVNFVIPFLLMLFRNNKRNPDRLKLIAFWILVGRAVEYYWLIAPTFRKSATDFHWLDAATFVGVGGIWLAVFFSLLKKRPLIVKHDPRFSKFAAGGNAGHH